MDERKTIKAIVEVDKQGVRFGNAWISFDRLAGCPNFGDDADGVARRKAWWDNSIIGKNLIDWANDAASKQDDMLAAAERAERAEAVLRKARVSVAFERDHYERGGFDALASASGDVLKEIDAALSPAPAAEKPNLLWAFNCRAERMDDGHYRVTLTGSQSGAVRTRTGYHPMWELIRLLAEEPATPDAGGAA